MMDFKTRILRAANLDIKVYEEVEADKSATGQAMLVVVLSSLAAGIGAVGKSGISSIIIGMIAALFSWYAWAFLTYFIGTRLFPEKDTKANLGETLRTIGFSTSPGLIRILGVFPAITSLVFLAAQIWMLIAMIVAVRQALDYKSTLRAIGVCVIGWVIQLAIGFLLIIMLVGGQPASV